MNKITLQAFENIELVCGTIISAENFPEANIPAYLIHADFGLVHGILKSSARITSRYDCSELIGRQIIGVINLPYKQIGPHISQFLVTGFTCDDGSVVLAQPDTRITNGLKLS